MFYLWRGGRAYVTTAVPEDTRTVDRKSDDTQRAQPKAQVVKNAVQQQENKSSSRLSHARQFWKLKWRHVVLLSDRIFKHYRTAQMLKLVASDDSSGMLFGL